MAMGKLRLAARRSTVPVTKPMIKKDHYKLQRVAKKLSRLDKSLNRQYFATASNGVVVNGTFTCWNAMITGEGDNDRNGNRAVMKHVYARTAIYGDGGSLGVSTSQPFFVRYMWLIDTQPNGNLPLPADLLNLGGAPANAFLASVDYNKCGPGKRFRILYDKCIPFTPVANTQAAVGAVTYQMPNKVITKRLKIPKSCQTVVYNNGNTGTVADISNNSLLLFTAANDARHIVDSAVRIVYGE